MLDRKKPFFIYLGNIPRLFLPLVRRDIRRFDRASSSLPFLIPPSTIFGCSPVLVRPFLPSESSPFALAFLAITRPFAATSSLFRASRSSFALRARDADAVCRTRAFAFSLRVTEHSIEPGRTIPPRSAELTRTPRSSIPPSPLGFYQPVDSPVATPIATDVPLAPLIPASSHEN